MPTKSPRSMFSLPRNTGAPGHARRIVAAGLAAVLVGGAMVAAVSVPAVAADAVVPLSGGTVIVSEDFTGSSVEDPNWVTEGTNDPNAGHPCLTGAAPTDTGNVPGCAGQSQAGITPEPGVTPGYLQLTNSLNYQAGSLFYNQPIPATAGLSVTFEQYQYGGNGADGIGFFLVDGATDLTSAGATGGSLGYAQRNNEPGIDGGVVGVGLDAYGNFFNDAEQRGLTCPTGQQSPIGTLSETVPNTIGVRGPGAGINGYCFLGATAAPDAANPITGYTTTLAGSLRANTLEDATRTVNIQVTPAPNPEIIVQVQYTAGGPWIEELHIDAPPGLPTTYKLGLSSSTGGLSDVHLVRFIDVRTIDPLESGLHIEKQVDRNADPLPAVITAGTTIPYQYTVTNTAASRIDTLAITDDKITTPITCQATSL